MYVLHYKMIKRIPSRAYHFKKSNRVLKNEQENTHADI